MLNRTFLIVSGCALLLGFAHPAVAQKNLIKALYHADFKGPKRDKKPDFSLDGELGLLVSTGNTNNASLKARLYSDHETRHWSNRYLVEMLYKQARNEKDGDKVTEVTNQRFFGSAQLDYKLAQSDQRLFLYGDYENDRFNGYRYQASLAAGWSRQAWQDKVSELRYSLGPGYGFAEFDDGTAHDDLDGLIIRASAEYRHKLDSGARFRQFLSTEAGDENTKSRSETSISANLFGSLAMKLSFILLHNSSASEEAEALSTETSVALVYRFF